jgi:hypothetical protein
MTDNPIFARLTAETTLRANISGLRTSRARWGETNEGRRSLSRVLRKICVPYGKKGIVKAEEKTFQGSSATTPTPGDPACGVDVIKMTVHQAGRGAGAARDGSM